MPRTYGQACPVAQSLEFLGERWTLLVVRDLLRGTRKFQDLAAALPGVAPGVLSHRLKVLEERGIVRRQMYSDHPPRAEYALTPTGEDLRPVVRALAVWGARHLPAGRVLVHDQCEHPIDMAYFCRQCDALVPAAAVSFRPRPARAHGPEPRTQRREIKKSKSRRVPRP